nr:hypothetical protein Iba_chr06aCG11250 [Ipomoea batatas]
MSGEAAGTYTATSEARVTQPLVLTVVIGTALEAAKRDSTQVVVAQPPICHVKPTYYEVTLCPHGERPQVEEVMEAAVRPKSKLSDEGNEGDNWITFSAHARLLLSPSGRRRFHVANKTLATMGG